MNFEEAVFCNPTILTAILDQLPLATVFNTFARINKRIAAVTKKCYIDNQVRQDVILRWLVSTLHRDPIYDIVNNLFGNSVDEFRFRAQTHGGFKLLTELVKTRTTAVCAYVNELRTIPKDPLHGTYVHELVVFLMMFITSHVDADPPAFVCVLNYLWGADRRDLPQLARRSLHIDLMDTTTWENVLLTEAFKNEIPLAPFGFLLYKLCTVTVKLPGLTTEQIEPLVRFFMFWQKNLNLFRWGAVPTQIDAKKFGGATTRNLDWLEACNTCNNYIMTQSHVLQYRSITIPKKTISYLTDGGKLDVRAYDMVKMASWDTGGRTPRYDFKPFRNDPCQCARWSGDELYKLYQRAAWQDYGLSMLESDTRLMAIVLEIGKYEPIGDFNYVRCVAYSIVYGLSTDVSLDVLPERLAYFWDLAMANPVLEQRLQREYDGPIARDCLNRSNLLGMIQSVTLEFSRRLLSLVAGTTISGLGNTMKHPLHSRVLHYKLKDCQQYYLWLEDDDHNISQFEPATTYHPKLLFLLMITGLATWRPLISPTTKDRWSDQRQQFLEQFLVQRLNAFTQDNVDNFYKLNIIRTLIFGACMFNTMPSLLRFIRSILSTIPEEYHIGRPDCVMTGSFLDGLYELNPGPEVMMSVFTAFPIQKIFLRLNKYAIGIRVTKTPLRCHLAAHMAIEEDSDSTEPNPLHRIRSRDHDALAWMSSSGFAEFLKKRNCTYFAFEGGIHIYYCGLRSQL